MTSTSITSAPGLVSKTSIGSPITTGGRGLNKKLPILDLWCIFIQNRLKNVLALPAQKREVQNVKRRDKQPAPIATKRGVRSVSGVYSSY